MAIASDVKTYITQLLETATKGNVVAQYAWFADRMVLHCKVCEIDTTCPTPKASNELDYSIQEFIKIHSHLGGHSSWTATHNPNPLFNPAYAKPVPVTADFKKLEPGKIVYLDGPSGQLWNVPKIDAKPEMEDLLLKQMEKYDAELQEKFKTQAQANKIKILQMQEAQKKQLEQMKQEAFEKKFGAKTLQELSIIEMEMESKLKQDILKKMWENEPEDSIPPPPKVKRDKPLKRPEGRKFR